MLRVSGMSMHTSRRRNSRVVENVDRQSELSLLNLHLIRLRSRYTASLCFCFSKVLGIDRNQHG
ncbi:hypothetical protein DPMN_173205 [Dreissena polymorpha]|uniref:Uncharacterized protein n=1 Tax=Dreissena polymorpha TaxID=45954 RepID=A0A9D4IE02_DREPO|nr:hypothetical protein DPMN_173205 [Dreissena polymorpha]